MQDSHPDISRRPFISICIPAFKRTDFLKRLFDSISIQTFRDFEVIVTDDSPGNDVHDLCLNYQNKIPVLYFKNKNQLGTPENWNEAITRSKGKWIKLMHDDDWFSYPDSLEIFANAAKNNPDHSFFFSAYTNIYLDNLKIEKIRPEKFRLKMLMKNPVTLYSKNIIGPPSVTFYLKDNNFLYDKNLKWLVDIDFYIRFLNEKKPFYIRKAVINVGISSQQVTKETFRIKKVEIPENFYLLNKILFSQLRNIYVYDAWWRFMRNLGIRKKKDIFEHGYSGNIPNAVEKLICFQGRIPLSVLRIGLLSKFLMLLSFILYFRKMKSSLNN